MDKLKYLRKWRKENPEKVRKYKLDFAKRNPNYATDYSKCYYALLKHKVLKYYTAKCACCGERHPEFLAVDHINNDGPQHRRKIGISRGGGELYKWLIKNNFPKGFQILCFNCNWAKSHGGCPHQGDA